MTRRGTDLIPTFRPAIAGLAIVVAAVVLGACGVETGNEVASADRGTTSTSVPSESESESEPESGQEDDGADAGPSSTTEPDDDTTTTSPGTTAPTGGGGSEADAIRDALIQGFESAGLTNEQATCLADGYIDLGLTDPENMDAAADLDVMEMMSMFSQCGISLEELGELGGGLGG